MPRVGWTLGAEDRRGARRVRWGSGRGEYRVDPGLYALGKPDASSPVLASANYKLSFDALRSAVPDRPAWLLVLDTKGVNVWCAAGKGTFGTDELVRQLGDSRLDQLVEARRVIVPQLGAPGVAAHEVQQRSGFKVVYGPVEASDLGSFLDAGRQATPEMRRKRFGLRDRAELIPVELMAALRTAELLAAALFLLGGLGASSYLQGLLIHGAPAALTVLLTLLAGAVVTPLLLPWLAGRAFALKGLWPGLLAGALPALLWQPVLNGLAGWLEAGAWLLFALAGSSYLAMLFTGASTYTSLSGVRREMRLAVPLQIAAVVLSGVLWIAAGVLGRMA